MKTAMNTPTRAITTPPILTVVHNDGDENKIIHDSDGNNTQIRTETRLLGRQKRDEQIELMVLDDTNCDDTNHCHFGTARPTVGFHGIDDEGDQPSLVTIVIFDRQDYGDCRQKSAFAVAAAERSWRFWSCCWGRTDDSGTCISSNWANALDAVGLLAVFTFVVVVVAALNTAPGDGKDNEIPERKDDVDASSNKKRRGYCWSSNTSTGNQNGPRYRWCDAGTGGPSGWTGGAVATTTTTTTGRNSRWPPLLRCL